MRGRPPTPKPPQTREDGLVKIYGSWVNPKPECLMCGNPTQLAPSRPKNSKYYRATCSPKCLGDLKSKQSSNILKQTNGRYF